MPEPLVLTSDAGAVRTLSLNRPAALNSFTTEMHGELMAALDLAAGDPEVRCLVLTGAGRAFCAGQDLADPSVAPDPAPGAAPKDLGHVISAYYAPLVARLRSIPVPVVAAVNGVAAGAGANIALCCDLVVAGRSASFIQAFTRIGLVPDTGGTWLLPRLVGSARALGMAMLGDKLPAEETARIGLIWQCVDDAALPETAAALASKLAGMPTRALVATRQAMAAAQDMDLDAALAEEARIQREMGNANDYREGVEAFRAKRAPVFKDR
ncbi:MAG: 2-(1,2-epoxy-1,2-dihydrophenyl)acetyl-CoA isomerase [Variovorax paradoxus]|nr:enoyl-CoA hydratase-related protein [Variovorax paradoxus]MBW8716504.1 2-(1,2-epoxy-1,2-dihydrophenyl)acetyl-CoA isomerase [Variovorax paradoxus]